LGGKEALTNVRLASLTRLACAIVTLGILTAASEATAALTRLQATAADMLVIVERMITAGKTGQAEQILQLLAQDPDQNVRSEARYQEALLLEARGELREAAVLLRRVLDDKPSAAPARLKLATILEGMGDEASALRELRAVRTSELPANVARFVDRLSASLQASKPLGFQFEVALAPDTNINRATRSETLGTVLGDFTFDEGSKARSGVGASMRSLAQAHFSLSKDVGLAARASSEANLYRAKEFDDIIVELAVGPEWKLGRTRLSAEAGVGQQWHGMKPLQRSLRLSASATQPIDGVSQLRIDAGTRWAHNQLNSLEDGKGYSLRLRYERALSPSLLIAASLGADRFNARDDAYSTLSWNGGISAYQEIGRMTLSASVEISRLKADERLSLLPQAQEDRFVRLSVGSVFRQFTFAGFAPVTRVVFERNKSTVEFYDYKRTRTEFGISRAF
jgi:tetratricopeptide (TPR) repeat protein